MNKAADYAYAVGRVKALESRLLESSVMQRMIDAADYDEALRFLSDSEYSGKLGKYGFERSLDESLRAAFDQVTSFSPDPFFTGEFYSEYDFLRLKACLKEALLASSGMPAVVGEPPDAGFLPMADLKAMASEAIAVSSSGGAMTDFGSFGEEKKLSDEEILRDALSKAAKNAVGRHAETDGDPMEVDSTIDSAYFAYILKVASARSAAWALGLIAAKSDLTNLLMVMRSITAGKDARFVGASTVPGGRIGAAELVSCAREGEDRLRKVVEASPYQKALSSPFEIWAKEAQIRPFEMAAEAYVHSIAEEARALTEGYAPVMGYLLMKQKETSMIRRILAGKAKAMPASFIRERLCGGNA